jgi:membrane protein implicated in regulation of membrane protease activity
MKQGNQWASQIVMALVVIPALLTFSLFELGLTWWALGTAALSILLFIVGIRMSRRSQPPSRFSQRTGRHPIPLRDGDLTTKVLGVMGVLVILPGIWFLRSDQFAIGGGAILAGAVLVFLSQRRFKRDLGDEAAPATSQDSDS